MTVLILADHDNVSLKTTTHNAVTAGLKVADAVDILIVGQPAEDVIESARAIPGVYRVLCVSSEALARQMPEGVAQTLVHIVEKMGYAHVFGVSGDVARAAVARAAMLMDMPAISDITGVVAHDTYKRLIYAGSVVATVKTQARIVFATVRTTAFEAAAVSGGKATVEVIDFTPSVRGFEFVSLDAVRSDRPDLITARRVVSGGRGLIDESGFAAMEAFADKIGAAVGSTRAIVDMMIAPSETQVGQTGKVVAPDLYFAFGISGAIQHTAGMKDSKIIVAVNKDPEAPIFERCDYYLQADAQEVIRELMQKL